MDKRQGPSGPGPMEPQGNGCDHGGNCGCMGHMHGCHGGRHHLVKIILKLFIVIIIFWCGFKLGEITGSIRAEYGRGNSFGMMNRYNNYSNNLPNSNGGTSTPAPAQ